MGRSQMPKYIFAAVLSLAACAATPQSAPEELNEPTLYDFLLGEIALQRGDVTLAAQPYLELAKHTRDPRVARRAVEVANLARLPDLAIEAAKTWLDIEPSSPQALQVTAALLIGSKRVEEAEPYLEKLLASDGVNLENGFMQLSRLLAGNRSEEHTSELQSLAYLVCRLLLEKKKNNQPSPAITQTPSL